MTAVTFRLKAEAMAWPSISASVPDTGCVPALLISR